MRSNKVHHLMQLQEDHCWQVFAKHVFSYDHPQLNAELKEIGTKIVQKCKGLPLALKSIGSLLHTKSSVFEWESVLLSKIWDLLEEDSEIVPALFLSYHHLPSHLKRCFAYCALFPKDSLFSKKHLIELWMAENFLQYPQQSKSPEKVGEQYFDDLLSRSFFQQLSDWEGIFVMHDLLNDLAKYVCGDICFKLEVDTANSIPKTTRHLSFAMKEHEYYFDGKGSFHDAKRLRTFIPTTGKSIFLVDPWQCKISMHKLFSKFKFLRILSLSKCSCLSEVPNSVGDLRYLRSLDLSFTYIRKLPDSICLLYNLQILKLNSCENLVELPSNLYKLANLRCLYFTCTRVRKMPIHLGKLNNLQVLSSFYVGKSSEFSIQQLGGLNLHGQLLIGDLQNIVNPLDALAADLKNKTHLGELALKWNSIQIPDDPRKEKEVLEYLQPSKHLKNLSIMNYGGTQFPSWLFDKSLSNMVFLRLHDCKYCLCLPPLGLLPFLKCLKISGLDGIVSIGAEFYGSISSSFASLKTLTFRDMKEWEEWECKNPFPRLQFLYIKNCPKLKGLSEQLHLKEVVVRDCERFTISGHSMEVLNISVCPNMNIAMSHCYDFLVTLKIVDGCDSLMTFPLDFFPKLRWLMLRQCRNLQMISQEHTNNHLKNLAIWECPNFESLPEGMRILLPSLTELEIYDCPQVEKFSDGGLPSNLKRAKLSNCSKLITALNGALGANTCLEILSIGKVDLESFPDEGFLPLSLTSLEICDCPDLEKLDYKGLCQLSSLKVLRLENCPSLQCLPEEGLPKSISTLEIWECPLLKQRESEDWGKIAHIKLEIRAPPSIIDMQDMLF